MLIQTWFQNHRSRAKQSLQRLVNADVTDTTVSAAAAVASTTCRQKTMMSGDEIVKKPAHGRKRATNDVNSTPPATATKRSRVSPPGELDETNADLTIPLPIRRRTFGELQMPVLSSADGDEMKASESAEVTKKVRYFSNFYRQSEPGEVFISGRLKVVTDTAVHSAQSIKDVGWTTDSRPYLFPQNSPLPPTFMAKPDWMTATQGHGYSLSEPSLAAMWSRYRFVHRTMTSFPPSLGHVMAYDVTESSLCRRS